ERDEGGLRRRRDCGERPDAADMDHVRLDHRDASGLDQVRALARAVAALSGGNRHTERVRQRAECSEVAGGDGLLEEERIERLERPTDASGAVEPEAPMAFDQQAD